MIRRKRQKVYVCSDIEDSCRLIGRRDVLEKGNHRGRLIDGTPVIQAGKNRWHVDRFRSGR